MKTNMLIVLGLLVVIAVVLGGRNGTGFCQAGRTLGLKPGTQSANAPAPVSTESASRSAAPVAVTPPPIQGRTVNLPPVEQPPAVAAQAGPPAKVKVPIQDPTARVALGYVGADAAAEAYWIGAINDPNLPAKERRDLIEDLNEDGLSDAKRPGWQDLPLILNRIHLIEVLAPSAMDQVNADAFAEACKDLVNLANGQSAR